ncbi:hypothetical protein Tco_0033100 [Tanacetum coccineum]
MPFVSSYDYTDQPLKRKFLRATVKMFLPDTLPIWGRTKQLRLRESCRPERLKKKSNKEVVVSMWLKLLDEYEVRLIYDSAGRSSGGNPGHWIEKVEQVFETCKCAEEDKVMFAASTFECHTLHGGMETTEIQVIDDKRCFWTLTLKRDDIKFRQGILETGDGKQQMKMGRSYQRNTYQHNNNPSNTTTRNRNNNYHQQQNRRQETTRAYAAVLTENRDCPPKVSGFYSAKNWYLVKDCRAIPSGDVMIYAECDVLWDVGEGHLKNKCPRQGKPT